MLDPESKARAAAPFTPVVRGPTVSERTRLK